MQGRHGQGGDSSEQPADPRKPLNGTGKYPIQHGTGKYPSINGTGKHPVFNGTGKIPSIYATGKYPSIDATGKQRAIPQRPPNMARVNTPPEMPRVPRPNREAPRSKMSRKLLVVLIALLAIVVVFAIAVGSFLVNAINTSSGPSVAATNFLSSVESKNYKQAYKLLGPAITLSTPEMQFTKQAETLDSCYGPVKNYKLVPDTAEFNDNLHRFTYDVTREKLSKPYRLTITLQQDPDDSKWKLTNYGNTLGPKDAPACKK